MGEVTEESSHALSGNKRRGRLETGWKVAGNCFWLGGTILGGCLYISVVVDTQVVD